MEQIKQSSETLRLTVRDALQNYIEENITFCDPVDTTCDLADLVFEALGVSESEQDIKGARIKVNLL